MKNKICVYAIAKNESQNVELWVQSMSAADHIIVLDTGSIDNTVELLTSLGVEVHQKIYEHFRFDVARNDSMDLIPEEYNICLCTDLDERFDNPEWANIIRKEWDDSKPRALYDYAWGHTNNGNVGLQFVISKIHGHDPNLRWKGAVHEHLTYMDTGRKDFDEYIDLRGKFTLHHYSDLSKDRMFYIQLMEERLKEEPDDPQTMVLLANEYRIKQDPSKAIPLYEKAIELFKDIYSSQELAGVWYSLGLAYYLSGQAPQAMVAYTQGIAACTIYRDNYYGLGTVLADNQMYKAAIGILEEAKQKTQRQYTWLEDNYTWTYGMYDLLGYCYFNDGQYDLALTNAALALQYEPTNEILQNNYNNYLNILNKGGEI